MFCGEKCYLRNQFPTRIEDDTMKFKSSEQLYHRLHCTEEGETDLADKVLKAPDALTAHEIVSKLKLTTKWRRLRIGAMRLCLSKIFRQNRRLRELLRVTGQKPIIQSDLDPFWSGNASYGDKRLDNDDYDGENMLPAV